jgi:murein DD-endopeptidase MepM/ murein hydrolase activator NlpD
VIPRRRALADIGLGLGLGLLPASIRAATPAAPPLADPVGVLMQGGWARGQVIGKPRLMLGSQPVECDADGRFFLAFDRDAPPMANLMADYGAAGVSRRVLTIAPRAWPIEHIDAPFHPPAVPDEAFAKLRAVELARIEAARAQVTGAQGWRQAFVWPAHGRISGRFGSQRIYRGTPGAYHSGLDIAPGAGATYVAPADGVVVLAAQAPFTLEGNLLMLDHGMGLNSAFLHAQRLLVREGDRVNQGQPLGLVGMTGRATGPHLHWSLRWREARLDPLLILPAAG